jgi:AcrR family transcriptional regulator
MGVRKEKAAETRAALKDAARRQFIERGYLNTKITDITAAAGRATGSFYEHFTSKEDLLQALLADVHGAAHEQLVSAEAEHPPHDLTDRDQLRAHLAVAWHLIRDNRPIMIALFESAIASGSGAAWHRMVQDTGMLREHLEHSRDTGHRLPGDPTLVAAAMGGMLSMLAYALPTGPTGPSEEPAHSDDDVIDTLTALLLTGLAGG